MSDPQDAPRAARSGDGTRRGRLSRVLSLLAVVLSFSVLAVSVGGYLAVRHYDRKVDRIPDVIPQDRRPVAAPARDARTILVVGSDSRDGLRPGQGTQGSGDDFVKGRRSDTMILVHLFGDRDTAQLVSFPRDSWVTVPAHTSPETGRPVAAREAKLNSAFLAGGPPLLVRTLEQLTGVRIDHYVQIDFEGFQAMVSALGGVDVCLSRPAKDEVSGVDLAAGRHRLDGAQALAFVRQRENLPGGDLGRVRRQQQLIGALVRKTLSAGTLANPVRLNRVVGVVTEAVDVDESLSIDELRDLALRFRDFSADDVLFSTVPVSDPAARRDRQLVVLLDRVRAAALFDRLRRDLPPAAPAPGAAAEPLIVRPDAVRVRVINGAGVPGLGRRAAGELRSVGFQVVGPPLDRGTSATVTTVYHGPDKADSARTLAAALRGARTQLDPARGRVLDVVIGSSYAGVTAVNVPRTPPAVPGPPVRTAAEDPCGA